MQKWSNQRKYPTNHRLLRRYGGDIAVRRQEHQEFGLNRRGEISGRAGSYRESNEKGVILIGVRPSFEILPNRLRILVES